MDKTIEKIESCIKKIEDKDFNLFFVVIDSKGTPSGSLAYIYETAKTLKDLGYKVKMLHAEKKEEFTGVESWLGEEYASLPHANINDVSVAVSPADFIFIPEIYSNVMSATKNFPCKRVAILQNFKYLTEVIPFGVTWDDLKIRDCITTSELMKSRLYSIFPDVSAKVVRPSIPAYFKSWEPKKLIINIISKNETEINNIIKPFYWKYPQFSWVAFRPVGNLDRKEFANALKDGVAAVWCDTNTDFGRSALEAMACGNIIIGKIPEVAPEWINLDGENDNGVWFYSNEEAQDAIAGVVRLFLTDSVPQKLYDSMKETVGKYYEGLNAVDVKNVYEDMFNERKKELEIVLSVYKKKNNEEEKVTE